MTTKSYSALSLSRSLEYTFKVQSRNLVGVSANSTAVTILAASKPDVPQNITTVVISNTAVTVNWDAPYNGASVITSYTVKIRQSDN